MEERLALLRHGLLDYATLSPLLATCMQPLTNPEWDRLLPQPVKIIFTHVFNILVWILLRRNNHEYETHISVAINHAADALLQEKLCDERQLQSVLAEFRSWTRRETEDADWDNAFRVGRSEAMNEEDIYNKIIGKPVNKGQCGLELAKEVVRQMRDEGKSFRDEWEEYYHGTSKTYSYNKEENRFEREEADVIVGSYFKTIPMTKGEMLRFIARQALTNLRNEGFEV